MMGPQVSFFGAMQGCTHGIKKSESGSVSSTAVTPLATSLAAAFQQRSRATGEDAVGFSTPPKQSSNSPFTLEAKTVLERFLVTV